MSNSQNEKILLPQAGIPGFVLTPRKNSSEDIVGEYREEVVHGDRGLAGDKTGISAKITFVVALCWAFFQMSTAAGCFGLFAGESYSLGFCFVFDLLEPSDS